MSQASAERPAIKRQNDGVDRAKAADRAAESAGRVTESSATGIAGRRGSTPPAAQLRSVLHEDFQTDPRRTYETSGKITWEAGTLTLSDRASIETAIKASPWTQVELSVTADSVGSNSASSELRVGLRRDEPNQCFIRFRRHPPDQDGNTGTVALVEVRTTGDRPENVVVRQSALDASRVEHLIIEYRHGLVRVSDKSRVLLLSHSGKNSLPITSIVLSSEAGAFGLTEFAVSTCHPEEKIYSAAEKQELAAADAEADRLIRLEKEARYAEAARITEVELEMRRRVQGEHHPNYAETLNYLASMYMYMGDYARAEPLLTEALEIWKAVPGEQHSDCATASNNLAALYLEMGDYSRAEPLFSEALKVRKAVLGEQHPAYASSLNNLAAFYLEIGDYSRAEPLFTEALEICRLVFGERHHEYANTLNNLASLRHRMNDYAGAEPLYRQALEINKSLLGEQHPRYANSLFSLGTLYETAKDFASAERLYTQALAINQSVFGKQSAASLRCLQAIASLYWQQGDFSRAELILEEALDVKRSVLGEQHPAYGTSLTSLAMVYLFRGEFQRAEPLFRQALEISRSALGEHHPHYANSLRNLATLYHRMGEYARAEPLFDAALKIQRMNLDQMSLVQSARQQERSQAEMRSCLDARLSNAIALHRGARECLEDLWQWKGAVTLRQQAYRQVSSNPHLAGLFAQLQSVSRQISTLANATTALTATTQNALSRREFERSLSIWRTRFETLTREREGLERQIARDSEEFRRIKGSLTVAEVQRWLPERTALLEFLEYTHVTLKPGKNGRIHPEPRYLAFVVRPDRDPAMMDLGPAEAFSAAVAVFRIAFEPARDNAHTEQFARVAAQQIRDELWRPLEQHLDSVDTVIISPDTALGMLPFAALPGRETGSFLIEDYRIATLPMASMLRRLFDEVEDERPLPDAGLLVVGDIDYSAMSVPATRDKAAVRPAWMLSAPREGTGIWQPLPGFQDELAIVRDRFERRFGSGVNVLRQAEATEAALLREAPRHHNLHVITHGYFASPEVTAIGLSETDDAELVATLFRFTDTEGEDNISEYLPGLLSGLALAGANNPPSDDNSEADGILTASEIETMNLHATDLVVLSACETGLGKVAAGEGLTGLQRAFQVAGARSTISSLWKVDDRATQEIMSRFYRYYWQDGQSKIDALRNAQLDIMRDPTLIPGLANQAVQVEGKRNADGSARRTSPQFWAAFQLSGDWR